MTPPDAPAVITLREVYDLTLAVKQRLDAQNIAGLERDVEDHEKRIRELEKWIWRASGLAALGGAGLGQVLGWIGV